MRILELSDTGFKHVRLLPAADDAPFGVGDVRGWPRPAELVAAVEEVLDQAGRGDFCEDLCSNEVFTDALGDSAAAGAVAKAPPSPGPRGCRAPPPGLPPPPRLLSRRRRRTRAPGSS